MHYLWAFHAAEGLPFPPFDIEHVERIYGWLGLVVPDPLRAAIARF